MVGSPSVEVGLSQPAGEGVDVVRVVSLSGGVVDGGDGGVEDTVVEGIEDSGESLGSLISVGAEVSVTINVDLDFIGIDLV